MDDDEVRGYFSEVERQLEVQRNCLAMTQAVHFLYFKKLDPQFFTFYKKRPRDSSFRAPNFDEFFECHREVWTQIWELHNEHGMEFNSLVHEFTAIRRDIFSFMQPRFKFPVPPPQFGNGKGNHQKAIDNGKGAPQQGRHPYAKVNVQKGDHKSKKFKGDPKGNGTKPNTSPSSI